MRLLLLLSLPLIAACSPPAPDAEPEIPVEVARVRRGAILQRITAPGSLLGRVQV